MAKPKEWPNPSTVQRISEILSKLPVLNGKHADVEQRAEEIVKTAEVVTKCLPHMRRSVSTTAAKKSLDQVANLAEKLSALLDGLSKEAMGAIDATLSDMGAPKHYGLKAAFGMRLPSPPQHPIAVSHEMVKLVDVAKEAQAKLAKDPKAGPRGRPVARPASDVAHVAGWAYESLTGKAATRGYNHYSESHSEFQMLLDELFAELGITASSERRARSLRDKTRKK
jgi:hypothetical protein